MRIIVVCLIVLLPLTATTLSAAPDRHALSGMDAVVVGEWLPTVLAFEASLAPASTAMVLIPRLAR